jgi:cyclopropane fatty-acyl-phospholipid synthase-like methyltransferase
MNFLQLKDISERYLELINPTTPEKILKAGRIAGMKAGCRIIDFGSGYAEPLILWAKAFNISGVGIELRQAACERASRKIAAQGLEGQLEIVCGDGEAYSFEPQGFDIATCIGATFIWGGGFDQCLTVMQRAVQPHGRLIIGEAYWTHSYVPASFAQRALSVRSETELLKLVRQHGWEVMYVLHSNQDEWDHYEAENWRGLVDWLDENPDHPEREQVLQHLHKSQEEYFQFGREFFGWGLYVLKHLHDDEVKTSHPN